MSDFLFSSLRMPENRLGGVLAEFLFTEGGGVREYHGPWGSLAVVTGSHGIELYEDGRYILVLVGEPSFSYHRGPSGRDRNGNGIVAEAVYRRWIVDGAMQWENDHDGPFLILCVDKETKTTTCVTDLISCIPAFYSPIGNGGTNPVVGTHIEAVALLAECASKLDPVSVADFIVTGTTTYPYTIYNSVRQIAPAAEILLDDTGILETRTYWQPNEPESPPLFKDSAEVLRTSIHNAVERICEKRDEIGLFLSGGEDSRVILAAMPEKPEKKAFIFLDAYNREWRTAKRVADRYGIPLKAGIRTITHYPDEFLETVRLVGSQNECTLHGFGFHREFGLSGMDAVIDGWWADSILKGYWIPRRKYRFRGVAYYPERKIVSCDGKPMESVLDLPDELLPVQIMPRVGSALRTEIYDAVIGRRKKHIDLVREFRPRSAGEWHMLWPMSQNHGAYNYAGHRRLFRHYSVFMASSIIKIGSSAPQEYKMNRRLFHAAVKDLFRETRFIPHADGHFPFLGTVTNIPLSLGINTLRKLGKIAGAGGIENQGPTPEWPLVVRTDAMTRLRKSLEPYYEDIADIFGNRTYASLFEGTPLHYLEQFRILQMLALRKLVEA